MPYPVSSVRNRPVTGKYLYSDFSSLPSWMTTLLGTLAVDSGALRASAIASDTYNMVANGEFTVDTGSWTATDGSTISRVDSAADPGAASGGVDSWCLKLVNDDGSASRRTDYAVALIAGATYVAAARLYSPSANIQANATRLYIYNPGGTNLVVSNTSEDTWQGISGTLANVGAKTLSLRLEGTEIGSIAYGDAFTLYHQSSIGYGNLYNPNALVVASVINPATLVTPRAITLRVVDELNYVRLLILPNTAGNDTILQTVTAGVIANVTDGAADVDWTAGGTDQVQVFVQGNTYTVQHMKSGESVWTTAFTATTASFNTSTKFGAQLFAAADNSFSSILIQPI